MVEERGGVLLTALEGSSREVAGGLRAHQWGVGASAQEGWRLAGAQGIPLSRKEGQTKFTSWGSYGNRLTTQKGSQEKQGSRGSEIRHPFRC